MIAFLESKFRCEIGRQRSKKKKGRSELLVRTRADVQLAHSRSSRAHPLKHMAGKQRSVQWTVEMSIERYIMYNHQSQSDLRPLLGEGRLEDARNSFKPSSPL